MPSIDTVNISYMLQEKIIELHMQLTPWWLYCIDLLKSAKNYVNGNEAVAAELNITNEPV